MLSGCFVPLQKRYLLIFMLSFISDNKDVTPPNVSFAPLYIILIILKRKCCFAPPNTYVSDDTDWLNVF